MYYSQCWNLLCHLLYLSALLTYFTCCEYFHFMLLYTYSCFSKSTMISYNIIVLLIH